MSHEEHSQKERELIATLYSSFSSMRDEWVQHRAQSGVEIRWRQSSALYFGDANQQDGSMRDILANGPTPQSSKVKDNRSRVVVNIVRPKVDQAVARMCEILLPVDDRNWAIRPTPKPEVLGRIGNFAPTIDPATGEPTGFDGDAEANAILQASKEAAEAMQSSIDDELTECNYNGESRKLIEDGVRMGTGILKGPFPVRHCDKVWQVGPNGQSERLEKESIRTASRRVDPWDVFPDPSAGNDHQRGRGLWERRSVTRKEIRALAKIPGYDAEAIQDVLRELPQRIRVAERRVITEASADRSYELWEYHGEIEPDEMLALTAKAGEPVFDVEHAVLIMINNRIIGAMKSWIEDKSIPYDFWCWRKDDNSPFGHGLPSEVAHQQSVVNAAWRQVMNNSRVSGGGQIVMKKGVIVPENGQWEITPDKVWLAKNDEVDVTKAFHVFEFQSHIDDFLKVAQAAMNFADMETTLPQIMGGEQGSAPETVGGMVMLYNNANAVLRQRVKLYDDCVTKPHIGRYYDFKMARDPDPKIKGDFDVDARGSTALVERDIQNQAILNLANITNMPRYSPHLKVRDELKAILKAFKMNPDDLMKTEEQAKKDMAATPAQQDPRIVSSELQAQTKMADIADRREQRQVDVQLAAQEDNFKKMQLEYNRAREQAEFTIAQTDSEINRAGIILREQNKAALTREQMLAKERLNVMQIESKHQIFNAEASLRVNTGEGI